MEELTAIIVALFLWGLILSCAKYIYVLIKDKMTPKPSNGRTSGDEVTQLNNADVSNSKQPSLASGAASQAENELKEPSDDTTDTRALLSSISDLEKIGVITVSENNKLRESVLLGDTKKASQVIYRKADYFQIYRMLELGIIDHDDFNKHVKLIKEEMYISEIDSLYRLFLTEDNSVSLVRREKSTLGPEDNVLFNAPLNIIESSCHQSGEKYLDLKYKSNILVCLSTAVFAFLCILVYGCASIEEKTMLGSNNNIITYYVDGVVDSFFREEYYHGAWMLAGMFILCLQITFVIFWKKRSLLRVEALRPYIVRADSLLLEDRSLVKKNGNALSANNISHGIVECLRNKLAPSLAIIKAGSIAEACWILADYIKGGYKSSGDVYLCSNVLFYSDKLFEMKELLEAGIISNDEYEYVRRRIVNASIMRG